MPFFKINKKLFGGNTTFYLECSSKEIAKEIGDKCYREALRLQKIFNFFDPQSELSTLNGKKSMPASPEMLCVLKKALHYCDLTGGRYDVAQGQNFKARKKGKPIQKTAASYKQIKIKNQVVAIDNPDILLDFGSIAKGYIVDRLTAYLKKQGVLKGLIDARGDIAIFGDQVYTIDIAHPRKAKEQIATIKIDPTTHPSIATSGDYRQYVKDFKHSHIIGQKDLISATVIGDTLMEADALATVLLVSDPSERKKLFAKLSAQKNRFRAMTIDKHLKIQYYNHFERLLISNPKVGKQV